jgi:hypothetical protein
MKKKIFGSLIVIAIAAVAVFNLNLNTQENDLSALSLANVEALAQETAKPGDPCYKGSYNSALPEATKCAQPCTKERCGGMIDKCY